MNSIERKFQRATAYKVPSRTVDYTNKSYSVETFVHPDNNHEQLGHIAETNMSYTLLNDSLRNLINKNEANKRVESFEIEEVYFYV